MLTAHPDSPLAPMPPVTQPTLDDYDRVRRAIAFISKHWRRQPSLDEIAGHVGLSVSHFHHLFRRWAGITPEGLPPGGDARPGARHCCAISASILDATYELGLSGPGPPARPLRHA